VSPRITRWTLAALLSLAIVGAILVTRESLVARRSADFAVVYSASLLIREGHLADVYDPLRLTETIRRSAGVVPVDPRLQFIQPIVAAVPFIPLSLLPFDLALRAWQLATVALLLIALLGLQRAAPLGPRAPALGLLALLASAPAWAALTEGQTTGIVLLGAALVVGGSLSDRPWAAALGAACLANKPQYLPAYLTMVLALRRWRVLGSATVAATLVVISPVLAGGLAGLTFMVRNAVASNDLSPIVLSESWIGSVSPLLPDRVRGAASLAVFAFSTLLLVWLARQRPRSWPAFAGVCSLVAILGSPHSLPHDLLLLAVPAWLAFTLYQQRLLPSPIAALALTDLALIADLAGTPFNVGPVVMTAALAWCVLTFRRRVAAPALTQQAA